MATTYGSLDVMLLVFSKVFRFYIMEDFDLVVTEKKRLNTKESLPVLILRPQIQELYLDEIWR